MRIYVNLLTCLCLLISGCKSKKITGFEKRGHYVINDSTLKNSQIHTLIAPYKDSISQNMATVISYCDTSMKRLKTQPETLLGNFVADLVFAHGKKYPKLKADFSLLNFGGLRNSLPKGDIKVNDIFKLMPFENQLVAITLCHDSLMSLTKYLAKQGGQPLSNAKIQIKDQLPFKFWIGGSLIPTTNTDKEYTVITSDYLANGGDHMVFFLNPIKRTSLNIKLRDAILEHCKSVNRISSKIEGRVTVVK